MKNRVRSVINAFQRRRRGGDVVAAIDALADVVQQGRQQELLVVRPVIAGQLENLERMIEHVALPDGTRGDCITALQRQEQHAKKLVRIDSLAPQRSPRSSRSMPGYSRSSISSNSADRGAFDRLAGDRAFEDVMGLVLGIDCQFEIEAVVNVDMRERCGLRRA